MREEWQLDPRILTHLGPSWPLGLPRSTAKPIYSEGANLGTLKTLTLTYKLRHVNPGAGEEARHA